MAVAWWGNQYGGGEDLRSAPGIDALARARGCSRSSLRSACNSRRAPNNSANLPGGTSKSRCSILISTPASRPSDSAAVLGAVDLVISLRYIDRAPCRCTRSPGVDSAQSQPRVALATAAERQHMVPHRPPVSTRNGWQLGRCLRPHDSRDRSIASGAGGLFRKPVASCDPNHARSAAATIGCRIEAVTAQNNREIDAALSPSPRKNARKRPHNLTHSRPHSNRPLPGCARWQTRVRFRRLANG